MTQSDDKAYFWCELAARNGNKKAISMRKNYKDEAYIFSSLSKDLKNSDSLRKIKVSDLQELEKLAIESEILEEQIRTNDNSRKERKTFKIKNVEDIGLNNLKNKISDFLDEFLFGALGIYLLISAISSIVVCFWGDSENTVVSVIKNIYKIVLGIPAKCSLLWRGYEPSEINTDLICEFSTVFLALIVAFIILFVIFQNPIFCLVLLIPIFLISNFKECVCLVAWVVLLAIVFTFISKLFDLLKNYGMEILETSVSEQELQNHSAKYQQVKEWSAEKCLNFNAKCDKLNLPKNFRRASVLMLLSSLTKDYNCKTIDDVVNSFEKILSVKQEISLNPEDEHSLYFAIRQVYGAESGSEYIKINENFDLNGDFMNGYRQYRQGRDYILAENNLKKSIEGTEKTEAGWAAWCLSSMYRKERKSGKTFNLSDEDKKYIDETAEFAKKMAVLSKEYGCMKSVDSRQNMITLLFNRDMQALGFVGMEYKANNKSVSDVLIKTAIAEYTAIGEAGDPQNKAEWHNYETHNIWAKYKSLESEYVKCTEGISEAYSISWDATLRAKSNAYKSIKGIRKELGEIKGKGMKEIDEYYDFVKSSEDDAWRAKSALEEEAEIKRETRSAAINREMNKFDRKADSIESNIHLYLEGSYLTNEEKYLSGKMSEYDYMDAQFLRNAIRDKHLEQVEKEYDSTQDS